MLTSKMLEKLNTQINAEFSAFYTYLSMSAWFESQGLPGCAVWMKHHAEEEQTHAMKIFDFVHDRRGVVHLGALPAPRTSWSSPLEAFEDAFKHELHVTELIHFLVDLAREERDHGTESFLKWFVDEQVEEEKVVDDAIQALRRVGDHAPGLFLLDRELGRQAAGGGD